MRDHDVQGELAEGFEPSPAPILGPSGLPERLPTQPVDDPPPRLCEQGPCRHYHHFAIQMDAATPIAGRMVKDAAGNVELVGEAGADPARLEHHHYCYPTTGVEFVLGSFPVLECSRWAPETDEDRADIDRRRDTFMHTLKGEQYKTALDKWRERQDELAAAEQKMIDEATAEIEAAEAARSETQSATPEPGDTP